MSNKILITGASGFLGKHLINNNFFSNCHTIGRKNTNNAKNFIFSDMASSNNYEEALSKADIVIHAAAKVHSMRKTSTRSNEEFMSANTDLTLTLAKAAVKQNVKKFIFISTAKVNGEFTSNNLAYTNTDELKPYDGYAKSKADAEIGLLKIARDSDMSVIIIRPPLVYGEGVKGNFNKLITLADLPIPLPIKSIKNKRSMVYVKNLVDLIITCCKNNTLKEEIFMVSDDFDLSLSELMRFISIAMGKKRIQLYFPNALLKLILYSIKKKQIYDRLFRSFQVDIKYTKRRLDWRPPYDTYSALINCFEKLDKKYD